MKSYNISFHCQQVTSNNTDSMMQPSPAAVMNSLVSETKVCNRMGNVTAWIHKADSLFILLIQI
jgi:hypothetical protein